MFAGERVSFHDKITISFSCCRFLAQERDVLSFCDFVVAELARSNQQNRLHENIEPRQIYNLSPPLFLPRIERGVLCKNYWRDVRASRPRSRSGDHAPHGRQFPQCLFRQRALHRSSRNLCAAAFRKVAKLGKLPRPVLFCLSRFAWRAHSIAAFRSRFFRQSGFDRDLFCWF